MSEIRVNNITNRDGSTGTTVAGIPVVDSTSHFVVPTGRTGTRYADGGENIVRDGLVLHLDAKYSYPGATGTNPDVYSWYDLSGNENNTEILSTVSFNNLNGGIFNYSGNNNSYADLKFANMQYFTVSLAIKYNATDIPSDDNHYPIISNASGGAQSSIPEHQKFNLRFNRSGTGRTFSTQFYQTTKTTGSEGTNISGPSFEDSTYDGKWSFHTITLDNNAFKYYINGSLYGQNTNFDGTKLQTFNYFRISVLRGLTAGWEATEMGLGIVKLYNRALAAAEVLQNYNATKGRFGL